MRAIEIARSLGATTDAATLIEQATEIEAYLLGKENPDAHP